MLLDDKNRDPLYHKKPLVLIVDEDADNDSCYARRLSCALEARFRCAEPIALCSSIWKHLFDDVPSLIIVSSTLRDIDAISLIRTLKSCRFGFGTCFFLLCESVNASIRSIVRFNGIDGIIEKSAPLDESAKQVFSIYSRTASHPCGTAELRQLIEDSAFFSDPELESILTEDISKHLLEPLRFNREHIGTRYLELIVSMLTLGVEADMNTAYALCAEYFSTSAAAVEKSVRYAIEQAWKKSSPYTQYFLFGNTVDAERGKPTNKEFVLTMVRHASERMAKTGV
ncbi:MAG: hypothetical protein IKS90_07305 [Clostridia bacterium]|nr:hypothetical protein [Clostridia bacterium]